MTGPVTDPKVHTDPTTGERSASRKLRGHHISIKLNETGDKATESFTLAVDGESVRLENNMKYVTTVKNGVTKSKAVKLPPEIIEAAEQAIHRAFEDGKLNRRDAKMLKRLEEAISASAQDFKFTDIERQNMHGAAKAVAPQKTR